MAIETTIEIERYEREPDTYSVQQVYPFECTTGKTTTTVLARDVTDAVRAYYKENGLYSSATTLAVQDTVYNMEYVFRVTKLESEGQ